MKPTRLWSLRLLRTWRELSQQDVAAEAGLHQTELSDLERGIKTRDPDEVARLAAALDVKPDVLYATSLTLTHTGKAWRQRGSE